MKQYRYKVNGAAYDVTINGIQGNKAHVTVNGIPFEVEMEAAGLAEENLPDAPAAQAEGTPAAAAVPSAEATTATTPAAGSGAGTGIKTPLPGVVTAVKAKVGQAVKKGETVVVLEAMKMENNIAAEADGTVTGVCVAAGDSVMEGTVLLTIA